MMAGTRAERNDEGTPEIEASRAIDGASPKPDGKLEDAVQRSMKDLEKEMTRLGDSTWARLLYTS